MNELIQSAQEAASQGEKTKALDLLKQVFSTNPNDIDALLVLASLAEEPTRKRQVVNKILSLDAVNRQARDMLLEMDRAELNSYRSQMGAAPKVAAPSAPAGAAPTPAPQTPAANSAGAGKPLVFRSSTGALAALYLFGSIFCCLGLATASRSLSSAIPSLGLAFLFGLTAVSLSSKVEVTEAGIRTSSWFGGGEMKWNEIARLQSNAFQRKLELTSHQGKTLKVSTQVKGYALIVELLRQKRPDLFGQAAPVEPRLSTVAVEASPSVEPLPLTADKPVLSSAFDGPRTFQKTFLRQYGLLLALIPFFFLLVWLGLASPEARTASFISAGVCGLLMLIPFFQVSALKVEPDKLTVETFFEQKELSARQIKEIKMRSLRGRYGRVTNIVNIVPVEGKNYPLGGFADGEEILYGFLMNWWNTYQKP